MTWRSNSDLFPTDSTNNLHGLCVVRSLDTVKLTKLRSERFQLLTLPVSFPAPAKINLGLEILARREDGYHELNTLFYRVDEPHDVLEVSAAVRYTLTCSDPTVPVDASNLVTRAFTALAQELPAIHIHLVKNIPHGAGLGGGSSDAAIALLIGNELLPAQKPANELFDIAQKLGADVPFFLSGERAMIGHGIGDILEPIELELPCSIVIAKDPSVSVSTKEAYEGLQLKTARIATDHIAMLSAYGWEGLLDVLVNDFEPTIFARYPAIGRLKKEMTELGAMKALMSGSGSAVFGMFQRAELADRAVEALRRKGLLVCRAA